MNLVNGYLKAHVAGIVAAVTLVITDLTNGGISTADQWAAIVGAFIAAFGLTAIVPNTATQAPVLTPAPAPAAPVVVAPTAVSPVVVQVPEAPPAATPLAPPVEAPPESELGGAGHVTPDAAAEAQVGHPDAVWTDECLKFVRTMFGLTPNGREGTAIAAWNDCPAINRHPAPCDPPANVPVFWSGGSQGFGHVAVSIGNGHIISTDISGPGTVSIVPLTEIHTKWGLTFLGWTGHLEGKDVYHEYH